MIVVIIVQDTVMSNTQLVATHYINVVVEFAHAVVTVVTPVGTIEHMVL